MLSLLLWREGGGDGRIETVRERAKEREGNGQAWKCGDRQKEEGLRDGWMKGGGEDGEMERE